MGIVLVHRMVSMDNGDAQPVGEGVCHPEGTELALGVDHIRPPGDQLMQHTPRPVHPQPGPRVDPVCADGTHVVDRAVFIGMQAVGQRDHTHLVPPRLQLTL